jgi:hypothetical protein
MNLAYAVHEARTCVGLSQTAFAQKDGISLDAVSALGTWRRDDPRTSRRGYSDDRANAESVSMRPPSEGCRSWLRPASPCAAFAIIFTPIPCAVTLVVRFPPPGELGVPVFDICDGLQTVAEMGCDRGLFNAENRGLFQLVLGPEWPNVTKWTVSWVGFRILERASMSFLRGHPAQIWRRDMNDDDNT